MFDIGGWEFLIIVIVALVVIGPKDLPAAIRNVSGWVRKARELAREFQSGLSEIARETELESVQQDIREGLGLEDGEDIGNKIRREVEQTVDPDREIRNSVDEPGDFLDDPMDDPEFSDVEQDEIERARLIAEESGSGDPERLPDDPDGAVATEAEAETEKPDSTPASTGGGRK